MSLLSNIAGMVATRAPSIFNPSSIGRSVGQSAGQALGQRLGGVQGGQAGAQIGAHIGNVAAPALMRGDNMQTVARQAVSPLAPYIGSQLGQYIGNQVGGVGGGSVGNQLGAQIGHGASALMNGGNPLQIARQTAYNMLPGIGQALSGQISAAPQVSPVTQPQQTMQPQMAGYAHGGHVEPHYAAGGYGPHINPMEIYNRMALQRMSAQPAPYAPAFAHGGYAMPSLREVVDMLPHGYM